MSSFERENASEVENGRDTKNRFKILNIVSNDIVGRNVYTFDARIIIESFNIQGLKGHSCGFMRELHVTKAEKAGFNSSECRLTPRTTLSFDWISVLYVIKLVERRF